MKYTTVVKNEKSKNKRDILKNILCNALYNILCTTITILNMIFYELFFDRSKYEFSVKCAAECDGWNNRKKCEKYSVWNRIYKRIYIKFLIQKNYCSGMHELIFQIISWSVYYFNFISIINFNK